MGIVVRHLSGADTLFFAQVTSFLPAQEEEEEEDELEEYEDADAGYYYCAFAGVEVVFCVEVVAFLKGGGGCAGEHGVFCGGGHGAVLYYIDACSDTVLQ